jgi:hypothetical protein
MPRAHEQVLTATALRDVVAAVPFQCGFHPRRSVVVLSLRGPRRRVGQVTRADLPEPEDVDDAVAELAAFVVRDRGVASMVVVYDDRPWDPQDPPDLALTTALLDELAAQDVPAVDAIYVTRDRYWSYLCRDLGCCPSEGEPVADARSSPVAAAYVLAGMAPLPDREALVARVYPSRPLLVAAVTDSAWRWLGAFAADVDDALGRGRPAREQQARAEAVLRERTAAAFAVLDQVLPDYLDGGGELGVESAGHLVAVLQTVTIRDEVMLSLCRSSEPLGGALLGSAPAPPPHLPAEPDLAHEDAVERLLLDLCVRVDGPLACAPLTMLAWHSWARGEGALARIAVDRARAEDPTYRLAVLLSAVLDHALAPDWVAEMRRADEQVG